MIRVFDPQWTVEGPLDKSNIPFNRKEERVLGLFQSDRKRVRDYFHGLLKLVEKHPDSPFLLARLAVGHLYLEDVDGALQLFDKAHACLDGDPTFEKYLEVLRTFVQKTTEEEDHEWSQPENSFIASPHVPPEPISSYSYGAVPDDNVKANWNALLSEDRKDFAVERYSRLLAVESNEIEHVFRLGGESLGRLVRAGFYTGAIDHMLDSSSGKPDPSTVVAILKDFTQALGVFTGILDTYCEFAEEHVCRLHAFLMKSQLISTVIVDDEPIDYLVPIGSTAADLSQQLLMVLAASCNLRSGKMFQKKWCRSYRTCRTVCRRRLRHS